MAAQEEETREETTSNKESYKFTASSYRQLSYEKELFELVLLSGVPLDYELFKVILELLKENVAPSAIVQVLKGLRSASDDSASDMHHTHRKKHTQASATNNQDELFTSTESLLESNDT